MKKYITIVLFFITVHSFSQNNVFKNMPIFIGDKVDLNIFTNNIIKFKTRNFSLLSYSASDNNIINRLILNIYNHKGLNRIETFFQSNEDIIKVSRLYWKNSFIDCYVDKKSDIEFVIKYDPKLAAKHIANMHIVSYKLLDSILEKTDDKLNNQSIYFTTRHSYFGLGEKESIYFNFGFNSEESNVYGAIDLCTDKSYILKSIHFILKNEETIEKQLTAIEKKELDNGLVNESNSFILTNEELKKIDQSEEVDIKIEGVNSDIKFQMTYPQKMSINDILNSNEYKNVIEK